MKITIEIKDSSKAESLMNAIYTQMHILDYLFQKNERPSTKRSADDLEEFYEYLRAKLYH
ncbi:hypothetical protein DBR40_09110 [Pedobacter sp. KBW01]|uniref:hypothetical protein n=1 Tax=Pedobacter sp. KBW01 TaxID=2153364 RepID=UPI000F5B7844|nr:hypothetical protein [Pedobacter sp. KBW01]RQO78098.1 hypothetical protein DBR40_09110 [Pedobacter sp. KBW01]